MIVSIEPFSVNKAWKGRRFRTDEYTLWRAETYLRMPKNIIIPKGEFGIYLEFGMRNKNADFDNPVKPFVDSLQGFYGFNDKQIKRAVINVINVSNKENEYIEFFILPQRIDFKAMLGLNLV